jgi:hypothetical protein
MPNFRKKEILIPVFLLLIAMLACSSSSESAPEVTDADREAVVNVVQWNLYYLEVEDINGAMNTIHEDAPGRSETQNTTLEMFNRFDLGYELLENELVSIDSDTAEVRVKQLTWKKAGDEPFRTNRITAVHTLKKSADGNWRIYSTSVDDVEY